MARRAKGGKKFRRGLKRFGRGVGRATKVAGRGIKYLKSAQGRKRTKQVMSALHRYGGRHGKHIVRLAKKGAKHSGAISKGLGMVGKATKYLM